MTEAEQFLISKFNQCVCMTHEDYPESIFHIHDKLFIREMKMRRVKNDYNDINLKITKDSIILFEQDYKNKWFNINYSKIWAILQLKYQLNHQQLQQIIKDTLLQPDKLRSLTPGAVYQQTHTRLLQPDKLRSLTPMAVISTNMLFLLQPDKLRSLTPTE